MPSYCDKDACYEHIWHAYECCRGMFMHQVGGGCAFPEVLVPSLNNTTSSSSGSGKPGTHCKCRSSFLSVLRVCLCEWSVGRVQPAVQYRQRTCKSSVDSDFCLSRLWEVVQATRSAWYKQQQGLLTDSCGEVHTSGLRTLQKGEPFFNHSVGINKFASSSTGVLHHPLHIILFKCGRQQVQHPLWSHVNELGHVLLREPQSMPANLIFITLKTRTRQKKGYAPPQKVKLCYENLHALQKTRS